MEGHVRFHPDKVPAPFDYDYILFAGCGMPWDELAALHLLDEAVRGTSIRVVYRPHPWRAPRMCHDTFRPEDFQAVVLDEQVAAGYRRGPGRPWEEAPDLDYYAGLVGHARAVVTPLSTMIVEAALVNTPGVALTYHDGYHAVSREWGRFDHFDVIDQIPGLSVCEDASRVVTDVQAAMSQPARDDMREHARVVLTFDERPYSERLAGVVEQMRAQPGVAPGRRAIA